MAKGVLETCAGGWVATASSELLAAALAALMLVACAVPRQHDLLLEGLVMACLLLEGSRCKYACMRYPPWLSHLC